MFDIKVNTEQIQLYLWEMTPKLLAAIRKELRAAGILLADHLRAKYLSGGSGLHRRTGLLAKSVHAMPPQVLGDRVVGGMEIGAGIPYARVHINRPTTTTIQMRGKMLTIPLGVAKTQGRNYGATRVANARSYPELFPWTSPRSGKKFLVRQFGKNIIPVFALRSSVRIKSRVDPYQVLEEKREDIVEGLRTAINGAIATDADYIKI